MSSHGSVYKLFLDIIAIIYVDEYSHLFHCSASEWLCIIYDVELYILIEPNYAESFNN